MKRLAVLVTILVCLFASSSAAFAQQFEFKLGFKLLADQIPDIVGQPLENEHWGDNGDSLQQTTTGLMAWRKADNWTAFTNGSRTWINGPSGVQDRPNGERFDWEALPTIELKGRGTSVTERFDLLPGLKIVSFTHTGSRNFIVQLMGNEGDTAGYWANEIGNASGRQAESVREGGQYLLNVTADGEWAITIEQPRPQGGAELPQTFSGKGKSVTPFVVLNPGTVVATMQHTGSRNFIVELMDKGGSTVDYLANQIGNFRGEKAVGVSATSYMGARPGLHLLSVNADGEWTITLQYR